MATKITSLDSEFERLMRENVETICSYGDNFMEIMCRDACDGHDVNRVGRGIGLSVILL